MRKHTATDPRTCSDDVPTTSASNRSTRIRPNRQRIISDAARTTLFHHLLTAAVETSHAQEAIRCESRSLTYAEADKWSSRMARVLIHLGIGTEDRVVAAIPRSIESVIATWAIIKAGAVLVPIDPDYPPERIRLMLAETEPTLGLTTTGFRNELPCDLEWLTVDGIEGEALTNSFSGEPISFDERVRPVWSHNSAWMIFTSGSSGTPKGVVVSHSGIFCLLRAQARVFNLTPKSRIAHFASPSFDASLLEFFLALTNGSTMVVVPTGIYGGDDLADVVESERVTHLFVTPSTLATIDSNRLTSVSVLAVGGEQLPSTLAAQWARGRHLVNVYGPTETTIATNFCAQTGSGGKASIGSPNDGMNSYVLDHRLKPVPAGAAGELYLSGSQLARGYHGRTGLTSSRFVADPFMGGGHRMYRTGDLARRKGDNSLEIIGRNDFQVKIRGFRVEPAEVDAAVASHRDVIFSVTVPWHSPSGASVLVSYVKTTPFRNTAPRELVSHLRTLLPPHMIPAAVVPIEDIPLTPTGKLDREALPTPTFGSRENRAPRSETESAVADVFADVLEVSRVGLDDNFFDLGGTSLLAVRAAADIRRRTRREVLVPWVIKEPDVEHLARKITDESAFPDPRQNTDPSFERVVLLREGCGDPLFCLHAMGGIAWSYSALAGEIDHAGPIYGLQSVALDTHSPLPDTIEAMADEYAASIRSISAERPCHLLGWSLGGVLAHSIAVQLQTTGHPVASLTLLDSFLRTDPDSVMRALTDDMRALGMSVDSKSSMSGDISPSTAQTIAEVVNSHPVGITPEQAHRMFSMAARSAQMINDHTPGTFHGNMLFFSAHPEGAPATGAVNRWVDQISGTIENHVLDARHDDLMQRPAVAEMSPILSRWLASTELSPTAKSHVPS